MKKGKIEKNANGLYPFQGQPPFQYPWLRDNSGKAKEWVGMHGGDKKRRK